MRTSVKDVYAAGDCCYYTIGTQQILLHSNKFPPNNFSDQNHYDRSRDGRASSDVTFQERVNAAWMTKSMSNSDQCNSEESSIGKHWFQMRLWTQVSE